MPALWRIVAVVSLLLGHRSEEPASLGRVLFIGNSLTAVNDLPGMVQALAESSGVASRPVESVTGPGYSLADHLSSGGALAAIQRGGWDVVVLQQGPSALDASRAELLDLAERFAVEIRKVGAQPALYAVWPESARFVVFDRVTESYRLAAEHVRGLFLPAGDAWRAAWRRDPSLVLYGRDAFHPSVLGTYVAALVIYERLSGRSPVGLPARLRSRRGVLIDIAPATARLVQEAAHEANALSIIGEPSPGARRTNSAPP